MCEELIKKRGGVTLLCHRLRERERESERREGKRKKVRGEKKKERGEKERKREGRKRILPVQVKGSKRLAISDGHWDVL